MIVRKLEVMLKENEVPYKIIHHTAAYTAQQTAEMAHIPGRELIKPVLLKADGKLIMVIEPANLKINFKELAKLLKVKKLELATESEFKDKFPDSEVGAMPPFGELYGLESYMDEILAKDENIVFNGGNHTELVEMKYKDFERLAKPHKLPLH